jgi:hypothetical protein
MWLTDDASELLVAVPWLSVALLWLLWASNQLLVLQNGQLRDYLARKFLEIIR